MRLAVAVAVVLHGCAGPATLRTFAGAWAGHEHTLKITRAGFAQEWIDDGCCRLALKLEFRLSAVHGTSRAASAKATVTAVRVLDPTYITASYRPRVGESRTIRLRPGVIIETITGEHYCGPDANWPKLGCGS
jgi:hypothetical protein